MELAVDAVSLMKSKRMDIQPRMPKLLTTGPSLSPPGVVSILGDMTPEDGEDLKAEVEQMVKVYNLCSYCYFSSLMERRNR